MYDLLKQNILNSIVINNGEDLLSDWSSMEDFSPDSSGISDYDVTEVVEPKNKVEKRKMCIERIDITIKNKKPKIIVPVISELISDTTYINILNSQLKV